MVVRNEDHDSASINLVTSRHAHGMRELACRFEWVGSNVRMRIGSSEERASTNSSALRKARIESEDDSEAASSSSPTIDFLRDVLAAELHIMLVLSVCSRKG